MPNHHTLEKPKVRAKIIALKLEGKSDSQIAAVVGGTRQGVTAFVARHRDLIVPVAAAAAAEVIEQTKAMWITDKVSRTRVLQEVADLTLAELREFGITIVEERHEQTDSDGAVVITKTRDYRGTMVKELRGLLKDAAIEEGQIVPTAPNKGGLMREVIIREYEGVPQEWIG